ncbi:hypothetical protein EST38_g10242 [Candolleomyces aberdarensis]|uniref:Uncharacterized protein n=1 Tax=Candolleomyces aberdarensis TaxID=2316362 RepID=A0A4Q2DAR2_9AGAR|nr:hypothetical protein EST38_g10242 [Candolleomyces aberdarensis]
MPVSEVIERAKKGNLPFVKRLSELAKENFSLDKLDVFIAHIATIDRARVPTNLKQADAGWMSFLALADLRRWILLNPPLRNQTVKRIKSVLRSIEYWAHWSIRSYPESYVDGKFVPEMKTDSQVTACLNTARVFYELMVVDDELFEAMKESKDTLNLALIWWTTTSNNEPPIIACQIASFDKDFSRGDLLTEAFFELAVQNPKGIAQALLSNRVCDVDLFTKRTIQRMRMALKLEYVNDPTYIKPGAKIENRFIQCVVDATNNVLSADPRIARSFIDARAPGIFMGVLSEFSKRMVKEYERRARLVDKSSLERMAKVVLRPAECIVTWATCISSPLFFTILDVLDNGLVEMLGNCVSMKLKSVKLEHSDSLPILLRTFNRVWSAYPKVLPTLFREYSKYLHTAALKHGYTAELTDSIMPVYLGMKNHSQYLKQKHRVDVCDHLNHYEVRDQTLKVRLPPKTNMRSFQLSIILYKYEIRAPLQGLGAGVQSGGKQVAIMDMTSPLEMKFEMLDEFIKSSSSLIPKYKKKRYNDLIARFRDSQTTLEDDDGSAESRFSDSRLMDGIFRFGELNAHLLVLFRRSRERGLSGLNPHQKNELNQLISDGFLNHDPKKAKSDFDVECSLVYFSPFIDTQPFKTWTRAKYPIG